VRTGADERHGELVRGLGDGQAHARGEHPNEHVHVLLLDEFADPAHPDLGLGAVVAGDDLDLAAAQDALALVDLVDGELDPVDLVLAGGGVDPRLGVQDAEDDVLVAPAALPATGAAGVEATAGG